MYVFFNCYIPGALSLVFDIFRHHYFSVDFASFGVNINLFETLNFSAAKCEKQFQKPNFDFKGCIYLLNY